MIKVLIADDESLVRAGIKAIIPWEKYGYTVVGEAWDGEDAYKKILLLKPDILITDIKMPKMDGIELLKKLKENNILVRSIILSCFDDFELVREGMKYGAKDYILKLSVEPEKILEVLQELKEEICTEKTEIEKTVIKTEDLKYLFVKKLRKQQFETKEQIKNTIKNLNLDIDFSEYRLIEFSLLCEHKIFNVENYPEQTGIMLYNILEQICKRYTFKELVFLENGVYLLISKGEVCKCLYHQISASMKEYANCEVYFGVSDILYGYQEFVKGIGQAETALKCSIFHQNEQKTEYDNLNHTHITPFTCQQEQELFDSLMIGNKKKVYDILKIILNPMYLENYSVTECFWYMTEVLNIFSRVAREWNWSMHEIPGWEDNVYVLVQRNYILSDCIDVIYGFTEDFIEYTQYKRKTEVRKEILEIEDYVRMHYSEEIDLNTAADMVNMSPAHFSNIFKKETGVNFSAYLTKVRMSVAKRLLQDPQVLIYQAAEQTGYANAGYFGKAFKKYYGVSPEEYKRAQRKGESHLRASD